MTSILCENVSIEFPRLDSQGRGFLNTLLRNTTSSSSQAVVALSNLNIGLKSGDRLALVGRNGAGKSTLLKVIAGILEPTSGRIRVTGSRAALTDVMLGMDPDASAYENMLIKSIYYKIPRANFSSLVEDISEFTELGERLSDPIRTYSTGMLLRFAFALSTSLRPDILIMDEMIGAGDFHFRNKAQARLDAMLTDVKILVIATHDEEVARKFCTKAAWIRNGVIDAYGGIDEVLGRYREEG